MKFKKSHNPNAHWATSMGYIPQIMLIPQTGHMLLTKFLYFSTDSTIYSSKLLFLDLLRSFFGPMAIIVTTLLKFWEFSACLFDSQVTNMLTVRSLGLD